MISILKTNRHIRLGGNKVRNAHCSNLRTGHKSVRSFWKIHKIRRNIVAIRKVRSAKRMGRTWRHMFIGVVLCIRDTAPHPGNCTFTVMAASVVRSASSVSVPLIGVLGPLRPI